MIDEIRITEIEEWPVEAVDELQELIETQTGVDTLSVNEPLSIGRYNRRLEVVIINDWPSLKRENLKHGIAKSLDKVEQEHGLTARLETVEYVEERDLEFE